MRLGAIAEGLAHDLGEIEHAHRRSFLETGLIAELVARDELSGLERIEGLANDTEGPSSDEVGEPGDSDPE